MVDVQTLLAVATESPPCGPNLEHDLSFFQLEDAARGRPEQTVGKTVKAGEDPKWSTVATLAQDLLLRSKDLRIAVTLTRALTRTESIPGLAAGLAVIHGLLERYWDGVHPVLDADSGDDPTERLSALAPIVHPEALILDVRDAVLVSSRELGQIKTREVEIALGRLAPVKPGIGGAVKPLAQIHAAMAAAFAADPTIPRALREAHEHALGIQSVIADHLGSAGGIDLKPLSQPLETLLDACEAALGSAPAKPAKSDEAGAVDQERPGGASGVISEIRSREEAVRVLDLVCVYLEQHEPSNPAPLLIRRAQRLMHKNFVEIVRDLMPDSLSHLERLAGGLKNE